MNSTEVILKQARFIDASVSLTTFTCFKKTHATQFYKSPYYLKHR